MRPGAKPKDTGRMAFREPDEPVDERPMIKYRPFWTNVADELRWLWAVEETRKFRGIRPEGDAEIYLERVCRAVGAKYGGAKTIPEARLPYKDQPEEVDV